MKGAEHRGMAQFFQFMASTEPGVVVTGYIPLTPPAVTALELSGVYAETGAEDRGSTR